MFDRVQLAAVSSYGRIREWFGHLRSAVCVLILLALISPALAQTLHPTDPVFLNTDAATDARDDSFVDIATDGSGTWVAVWLGVDHPVVGTFFARSTDNGATWSPPAMISPSTALLIGGEYAKVASTGPGSFTCVWQSNKYPDSHRALDRDVLSSASSDGGKTWSAPVFVNSNPETGSHIDVHGAIPTLAVDSMGQLLVVWLPEARLAASSLSSDGQNWSSWSSIPGVSGFRPSIATDGDVHWVLAWDSGKQKNGPFGEDGDVFISRSTSTGQSWAGAAPLNTDAAVDDRFDRRPSVASNGAGTWIAAWEARDSQGGSTGTDDDLLFARSTDNGVSWSEPRTLNSNAKSDIGNDNDVRILGASAGRWIAVWSSSDTLEGQIGVDGDILYAISFDDGETWTDPDVLNTDAGLDEDRQDWGPAITGDGLGNYVIAWSSLRGTPYENDYEILVTRFVLPLPLSQGTPDDEQQADDPQNGTGVEGDPIDQGSVGSGDDAQSEPIEENAPQLCGLTSGASLMALFATFGIVCMVRRSARHQTRSNSRSLR